MCVLFCGEVIVGSAGELRMCHRHYAEFVIPHWATLSIQICSSGPRDPWRTLVRSDLSVLKTELK